MKVISALLQSNCCLSSVQKFGTKEDCQRILNGEVLAEVEKSLENVLLQEKEMQSELEAMNKVVSKSNLPSALISKWIERIYISTILQKFQNRAIFLHILLLAVRLTGVRTPITHPGTLPSNLPRKWAC